MNISVELQKVDELHIKGLIGGEIDAFTAPMLREKLAELNLQKDLHVELNLTDVSYMDSTGLGVFVGFYKTVNAANGHMELTGLSSRLKRLFDITGLVEIMDIQATDKEVKIDETV
ncbi:anti-sigma B factor antagonist [Psychrobacillus sp. OK028]|uniref:anti-sigma factor antagonist n=1 Tax=Psychrobacillus sp. OK028 TaxID=1884359 RepID=UPI0008834F7F|nr:anti-sigma factor antagonist [Psychrobacillus sp. OK028]SDN38683.1 anti-sigma B factor antagonist [Psychrobacillus sp. OK028]